MAVDLPATTAPEAFEETKEQESRHLEAIYHKTIIPRWNQKGRAKSAIARVCSWIVDHQIRISLNILSVLFLAHTLQPTIQQHTRKFFQISYYNASTGSYALGWDDIFFVFFWIVVFTGLRCIFMDYILSPLAGVLGLKKRKEKTRFAEQTWTLISHFRSFATGMYIIYNSDYWLNLRALWSNWPQREMDGMSKWYYLVSFAFWLQQIVVVNIEERRKDHWQMFTHHLITCALIFGSYGYHWTKVGVVILCLMDNVDVFLALAKTLKYLHYTTACDVTFGVFMVAWFICRHVIYMWLVWSAYVHSPQEIRFGCYQGGATDLSGPKPVPDDWRHVFEPFVDPIGQICFNRNVQYTFIGLLLALQGVMLMWFVMIVRVAYKVITGQGAEDSRSDDEDEVDDEDEIGEIEYDTCDVSLSSDSKDFLQREVLSTDPTFIASQPTRASNVSRSPTRRSSRRKGEGHSSSVNILAGSDRKELLGRIGCDKGAD